MKPGNFYFLILINLSFNTSCDRSMKVEREHGDGNQGSAEQRCLVEGCDASGMQKGPILYGDPDTLAAGAIGSEKYIEPLNLTEKILEASSSSCQHVILVGPQDIPLYASLDSVTQAAFGLKSGTLMKAEEFVQAGPRVGAPDRKEEQSQTWLRVTNLDATKSGWVSALYTRCR